MKHYVCKSCGNLAAMINDTGRRIGCCGKNMDEVVPVKEASHEKHTPVLSRQGNTVTVYVGDEANRHPMNADHMVNWVCLVTDKGSQRKLLLPGDEPRAIFYVEDKENVINAFAYCNLHGLWVDKALGIK